MTYSAPYVAFVKAIVSSSQSLKSRSVSFYFCFTRGWCHRVLESEEMLPICDCQVLFVVGENVVIEAFVFGREMDGFSVASDIFLYPVGWGEKKIRVGIVFK